MSEIHEFDYSIRFLTLKIGAFTTICNSHSCLKRLLGHWNGNERNLYRKKSPKYVNAMSTT